MLRWRVSKAGLSPVFVRWLEAAFEALPDEWVVISGLRTSEQQKALWAAYKAGGPRAAPPGYSAHEFGLAVDVVLDGEPERPGLQPSWDVSDPRWRRMIEAIEAHPKLETGASFGDAGHIQVRGWKRYKGLLSA